jgi:REP element-mobilizing transposase RayT
MKQLQLILKFNSRREHGGTLSLGKRRKQRPLSVKTPLHLVLKSDFAFGSRSLLRHRPLIAKVIAKAKKRFYIRVYEMAVVSNHIHLVVKGYRRRDLQNFFRVVAGHIAQEILREFPIERGKRGGAPVSLSTERKTRETENKFWQTRIYSRIVTWGREYLAVKRYVIQNTMEALGIIPYIERKQSPKSCRRNNENSS